MTEPVRCYTGVPLTPPASPITLLWTKRAVSNAADSILPVASKLGSSSTAKMSLSCTALPVVAPLPEEIGPSHSDEMRHAAAQLTATTVPVVAPLPEEIGPSDEMRHAAAQLTATTAALIATFTAIARRNLADNIARATDEGDAVGLTCALEQVGRYAAAVLSCAPGILGLDDVTLCDDVCAALRNVQEPEDPNADNTRTAFVVTGGLAATRFLLAWHESLPPRTVCGLAHVLNGTFGGETAAWFLPHHVKTHADELAHIQLHLLSAAKSPRFALDIDTTLELITACTNVTYFCAPIRTRHIGMCADVVVDAMRRCLAGCWKATPGKAALTAANVCGLAFNMCEEVAYVDALAYAQVLRNAGAINLTALLLCEYCYNDRALHKTAAYLNQWIRLIGAALTLKEVEDVAQLETACLGADSADVNCQTLLLAIDNERLRAVVADNELADKHALHSHGEDLERLRLRAEAAEQKADQLKAGILLTLQGAGQGAGRGGGGGGVVQTHT